MEFLKKGPYTFKHLSDHHNWVKPIALQIFQKVFTSGLPVVKLFEGLQNIWCTVKKTHHGPMIFFLELDNVSVC